MAYGRIDVFWPDGKVDTFALDKPSVSVGRSSGNTVTLDTDTISRYHFSITEENGDVYITDLDSANGTFVDGVRLSSNEKHLLEGVEEIQVGHLRIIFHPADDAPTLPLEALGEDTQRVASEELGFRVEVEEPEIAISPGAYTSAELIITNDRDSERQFRIDVTGIPEKWVRINRPYLSIEEHDSQSVLVNFKPLRRSESMPGIYPVTIRVRLDDATDSALEVHFNVKVLAFGGFGMAMATHKVENGDSFRLHLHNQGSGDLPITVSGVDKRHRLDIEIPSSDIVLTPGQRLQVQGRVKTARTTLFGAPIEHPFDLVVRSQTPNHFTAAVSGVCIETPRFPTWTAITAGGIALSLIALLVIALLFLQPTPQPAIAVFDVNSTQIARGDDLALNWQATDVISFNISLNGTPVATNVDGKEPGINLSTGDLHGEVTVLLEGLNGETRTEAQRVIQVYEPLRVDYFTVEPTQLVRNVVQSITLDWSISGAVNVRLSGLDSFSTAGVATEYKAQDSITDLVGIATDAFTVTLFAEDEIGSTMEQTVTLNVINPECTPATGDVTLHVGPDIRHQVVGTIPADTTVVVNAQDETGTWLRAVAAGGVEGWGLRETFICAETFNVSDLRIELNVPAAPTFTPTFTPTLVPSPTITPSPTLTLPPPTLTPETEVTAS